jgi:dTDP-4-amino-4,6-dideoxygalactose transaminase/ribosomal protein S18 acetylase RimI-like enzyme
MRLQTLDRESIEGLIPPMMRLEGAWRNAGETLWDNESFRKPLPGKFSGLTIAAVEDDQIAGYIVGSQQDSVARIHKIVVDAELRRKGVGSLLWDQFLKACRTSNVKRLEFRVLTDNKPAINFYKRKGCVIYDSVEGADGKVRHNVEYVLRADKKIPHSKLALGEEAIDALISAVYSGNLTTGEIVRGVETETSALLGKAYGVAANSGGAALFLLLSAMGASGKEVVLPSYVCGAVLSAVENCGAIPVFADIDEDYNLSGRDVKEKLNKKTCAVILPHMFGKPADLGSFLNLGVPIIEDCAHAIGGNYDGKPLGSFGYGAITSFYSTKNIPCSRGGLAAVNDSSVYEIMKDMLNGDRRGNWQGNYPLQFDDLRASVVLSQIPKLPEAIRRREKIAQDYNCFLGEKFFLPQNQGTFFRYVVQNERAPEIIDCAKRRGVSAERPVFMPLHRYKGLSDFYFPKTSGAYQTAISVPINPSMSDEQVRECAGILLNWESEK